MGWMGLLEQMFVFGEIQFEGRWARRDRIEPPRVFNPTLNPSPKLQGGTFLQA